MSEAHNRSPENPRPHGRVGTIVAGRWRIEERIGSGGMATVYAVVNHDGHRAALKMLHTQLSRDPSTRARFIREGKVANVIAHPGVVRVEDDGVTDDGAAFLVFELLDGETIEARRQRLGGSMPLEEVLDTADQALDALAVAHERQIIHRDVKPENFFLCHDGTVKLLDFGLARMKDGSEATRTGVMVGTPEFMPPEQALGRRDAIDARSDVWGLGATMFNAITGTYVHDASSLHEQLIASATKRARPIRSVAPFVPGPIASVIDRALELDQNDRWQSAREMQTALRQARSLAAMASSEADSLTFPITSRSPSSPTMRRDPSSSERTRQVNPLDLGTSGTHAASFDTTVALDHSVRSPMPVSPPIPITERISPSARAVRSPRARAPYAPPPVPAYTPSSVRAIQQASFVFRPPPSIPMSHASSSGGPLQSSPPPSASAPHYVAPSLRSSARPVLVVAALVLVLVLLAVVVAARVFGT